MESIGKYAFENNLKLVSVTFPESLQRIEELAFKWCYHLPRLTFPKNLAFVGSEAFDECRALTSLRFLQEESKLVLQNRAFSRCISLSTIEVVSPTPLIIGEYGGGSFFEDNWALTLYVPRGSYNAYIELALRMGSGGTKIVEYDPPTSLLDVAVGNDSGLLLLAASPGTLQIFSLFDRSAVLYNGSGLPVRSLQLLQGENTVTNLSPGIYFLDGQKVIVK